MGQLNKTAVLYLIFAQIAGISTDATTPTSIIGQGIGNKTMLSALLKVGSTISIVQTGKMTSGVNTQGAVTFKINNTTIMGNLATLPNNLEQGGLRAVWDITIKSIDANYISLQVAVQSGINSIAFVNVFNRINCVEMQVPIASSYEIDLLYHFNNSSGALIEIGQTIIKKTY